MAKKMSEKEIREGAPGWIVTYGDMMTLLLTFFVLIVSFSSIQDVKFQKAIGSLRSALGVVKGASGAQNNLKFFRRTEIMENRRELVDQVLKMKTKLAQNGLLNQVKVTLTEKGAHIVIADPMLFDLGSDKLKSDVIPALDMVADLIKSTENTEVIVEGHTDNWPINNERFPSNWELSAARALSVVKYLAFNKQIEPERFAAIGYGEYRPVKPNDSSENRSRNRRVEIFINPVENGFTAAIPEEVPEKSENTE